MDKHTLDRHRRRLRSRMPLVGGLLRRWSARVLLADGSAGALLVLADVLKDSPDPQIAETIRDGLKQLVAQEGRRVLWDRWAATREDTLPDLFRTWNEVPKEPQRVRVLCALLLDQLELLGGGPPDDVPFILDAATDRDETIACKARHVLLKLESAEAREKVCRVVIEQDRASARATALAAGYLPRDPDRRALFYFLTDQWQAYEELDFDHRLLRAAYQATGKAVQERVKQRLRDQGRPEWLEVLAVRPGQSRQMSPDEWQLTIDVLARNGQTEVLWQHARNAPPRWAAHALRLLREAGWLPAEADRQDFERLLSAGAGWSYQPSVGSENQLRILSGHEVKLSGLAFSPEGQTLASSDHKGVIRLWNPTTAEILQTWNVSPVTGTTLLFSPTGELLLSKDHYRTRLWKVGEAEIAFPLVNVYPSCVAFSQDGRYLAGGTSNSVLHVADLEKRTRLSSLTVHQAVPGSATSCITFNPEGNLIATGDMNGKLRLWSFPSFNPIAEVQAHHRSVSSLAFSVNGLLLASTGLRDQKLKLWDVPSLAAQGSFNGHTNWVSYRDFEPAPATPPGKGHSAMVRLWRNSDGQMMAARLRRGSVRVCNLYNSEVVASCRQPGVNMAHLAASTQGRLLASAGGQNVYLWGIPSRLDRLCQLPVSQASLADWQWAQARLQRANLSPNEVQALRFLDALYAIRWRHEIHVESAGPMVVSEFDIAVEG